MKQQKRKTKILILPASVGACISLASCTGQIPSSFQLEQQYQSFSAQTQVNTKVDLLWVVDNSSSMDVEQDRLRQGFASFANTYLQPTWDIQVAVITTDTYLANTAYTNYLTTTVAGTVGYNSPYITSHLSTFASNSAYSGLINPTTGDFDDGITPGDLVPSWGTDFAKLLPGMHDGPLEGLCFEGMPWFFNDGADCSMRDLSTYTDATDCLSPNAADGETSDNMCVNTLANNTVHSGQPILKTMPSSPLTGSALTAWTNQLISNFEINASTGVDGMGSERGIGSVLQLINDNETTGSPTAFFRPGSLRGIIFVSDEDDQTQTLPAGDTTAGPWDGYMCDEDSLNTMNASDPSYASRNFCCPAGESTTGGNCTYGASGTSCPAKIIDGVSWTVSICPTPSTLMPTATVKAQLDSFFENLDGGTTTPNYFIATITPLSMDSITTLQALHDTDDAAADYPVNQAVDRGDQYLALGDLVGNGSLSLDISSTDYTPLLDQIGEEIILQKGTFPLTRTPTDQEQMVVTLVHADGTSMVIPDSDYTVSGNNVIITDESLVLSFTSTDQIQINYEPKYVTQ